MDPLDQMDRRRIEAFVRGLSAAARTLRLYPPTSPIPRQALGAALDALTAQLDGRTSLNLAVGRDGFTFEGEPIASGAAGSPGVAEDLRAHGAAEVVFLPGCSADDLLALLTGVMSDPESVRAAGGLGAHVARSGTDRIRVSDVELVVLSEDDLVPDADIEGFLRELGGDVEKLNTWITSMARRESAVLSEGLAELVSAAGPGGLSALAANLASVFGMQDGAGKDALLGATMDPGAANPLMRAMLAGISDGGLAGSLSDGLYGRNMLSLSNALSRLRLEERLESVIAEVKASLASGERSDKEVSFLDHMLDVYERDTPEPSLVEADPTYFHIVQVADVSSEEVERARTDVSSARSSARAVMTMLALLDQQTDHDLYCAAVDNLARIVPSLIESRELTLAQKVVGELRGREARSDRPWPDFAERLRAGVATATGTRSMVALVSAIIADEAHVPTARELLRNAGGAADVSLAAAVVARKEEGIAAAEAVIGRRIVDLLAAVAPTAAPGSLAPIVARLAHESDTRAATAVRQLLSRPDEQSRKEVVAGLRAAGGEHAAALLETLLRDESLEVAVAAARALGAVGSAEAARSLATRLGELEPDTKDFALAREVIGALARTADPIAVETLRKLAERRALIKRGRFAEIQQLAREALEHATRGGGE